MASVQDIPLYRIVLTGGPCGGKTTALARLSSYLRQRGFEVFTVPEAFTILCSNGLTMDYFATREGMDLIIQGTVLELQESLEDGMEKILRARGKPAVILCDRGFMDGAAYMGNERFQTFLQSRNKDIADAREGRYNAVIHMVTAADGAPSFYSLENNVARSETPEEAIALDQKTQKAWMGHPRLLVLDNTTDFEGKMQRLIEAVAKLVGLPTNLSRAATKYKLRAIPDLTKFTVEYQIFEVEKIYLLAPVTHHSDESSSGPSHQYSFIRKRAIIGKDGKRVGGSVYGITLVQKTSDGQIMEMKRIITSREYASSMKQRDVTRHIIQQKRISFLYKHQSFSIHIYEAPVKNLYILHAQVEAGTESEPMVDLPPFLDVECRIHNNQVDDAKYGAFAVSLIPTST